MDKSYISYIDTDSLFIKIFEFLENQGIDTNKWSALPQDIKVKYLLSISKCIEGVVNNRSYEEIQRCDYNSYVDQEDFGIVFKQEIICSNILHLGPKMYAYRVINDEGWDCDKIDAKGIEIVRSTSPRVFRNALKELLEYLLKGEDDTSLNNRIMEHQNRFRSASPEDVSVNTGVNKLLKYIKNDFTYVSGTPYHIKGVANYHFLLQDMKLTKKYQMVTEADKCKVVYIKKNKYGINVLSYYKWPKEFNKAGIQVDYDLMIDKYFTQKAHILLDPINREKILEDRSVMDLFF